MSMHNNPNFNTPEIRSALIHHGHDPDKPSILADAFRCGWLAAQPDWERGRCLGCTCEHGGLDCSSLKRGER